VYDEVYKTPNYGYPKGSHGRNGQKIIAIGLHISGGSWSSNYNWITNPKANASYNAIVKDGGKIVSLVPEENAAYSHGKIVNSTWPLLKPGVNPNLYTLSLARTGSDQRKWSTAQLNSTIKLLKHWCSKYEIKPVRPYIFGHFEIDSVDRWYCPGKNFFETVISELSTVDLQADERSPLFYSVVAGSFRYKSNAENRVLLLAKIGIKAFVSKEKIKNGQDWYRVITGSYTSADHARLYAAKLQKIGLDSFVAIYREG
jgi:hypothetical protein